LLLQALTTTTHIHTMKKKQLPACPEKYLIHQEVRGHKLLHRTNLVCVTMAEVNDAHYQVAVSTLEGTTATFSTALPDYTDGPAAIAINGEMLLKLDALLEAADASDCLTTEQIQELKTVAVEQVLCWADLRNERNPIIGG